eukprot:GFYU01004483.1.p1 GENE.GFYU01004483.1~~GFYU01004483.1.p1  ORF type:complete len:364 (-),score=97.16 GFYU01004483.1:109-1200(-)
MVDVDDLVYAERLDSAGRDDEFDDDMMSLASSGYAAPTAGSQGKNYFNKEQDVIRDAFNPSNFQTLRALPAHIKHHKVIDAVERQIEGNRNGTGTNLIAFKTSRPKGSLSSKGLFWEFNYEPVPYNLADEIARKEKERHMEKIEELGANEFRPAGDQRKLKYEEVFEEKDPDDPYESTYPFSSDPFSATEDATQREKWLQESKILHGPFVPAGKSGVNNSSKLLLPTIMESLERTIIEDWKDLLFTISVTEQELLEIKMKKSTIESMLGITTYMNVLARTNPTIQQHKFKKVVEQWNVDKGDGLGYLYFAFRPPWVKANNVETFYALHPEEKIYTPKTSIGGSLRDGKSSKTGGSIRSRNTIR